MCINCQSLKVRRFGNLWMLYKPVNFPLIPYGQAVHKLYSKKSGYYAKILFVDEAGGCP